MLHVSGEKRGKRVRYQTRRDHLLVLTPSVQEVHQPASLGPGPRRALALHDDRPASSQTQAPPQKARRIGGLGSPAVEAQAALRAGTFPDQAPSHLHRAKPWAQSSSVAQPGKESNVPCKSGQSLEEGILADPSCGTRVPLPRADGPVLREARRSCSKYAKPVGRWTAQAPSAQKSQWCRRCW